MSKKNPAIYKVRESDLPRAYRKYGETVNGVRTKHWWTSDGDWAANEVETPEEVRSQIRHHLRKIASLEATARAIETEGFPLDPETKAEELYEQVREGEYRVGSWEDTSREVRNEYRRIAIYFFGGHNVDC